MSHPLDEGRKAALRGLPFDNPHKNEDGLWWAKGFIKGQDDLAAVTFRGELKKLQELVGATIKKVWIDPAGEGTYFLELEDTRVVSFSSSGDDMTSTGFEIQGDK